MKGIILAGGSGSRLYPLTTVTSKQLLPIYDKPMIYYPMSTLMMAGIKDILIISTPHDISRFESLLGDGNNFGISLSYKVQNSPDGLAQAFLLGEDFINNEPVCMILGDNIFYGDNLKNDLKKAVKNSMNGKATIFSHYVDDPQRFGVVEFDKDDNLISISEKPSNPKSNYAVTGIYFYDKRVVDFAKKIKPSKRGELEITDLNIMYLLKNDLNSIKLCRDFKWLDAGTHESLLEATIFVKETEKLTGQKISCPEEVAYDNGWISKNKLKEQAKIYEKSQYGEYLFNKLNGGTKT